MKIKNLIHYVDNKADEAIFNALNQSEDVAINNYVINVTTDLLNVAFVIKEFKINALNNLKNFSDHEVGEIGAYATLTPYVQCALQQKGNWEEKANSFLEVFISYFIGTTEKEDFINNLLEMKKLVKISDKFYNGLVIYFRSDHSNIRESVLTKIN